MTSIFTLSTDMMAIISTFEEGQVGTPEGHVRARAPDGNMTGFDWGGVLERPRKPTSPFRYFNALPEIIRLAVLMYVR